ncbi:MAG: cobalt-precorrin-5B (C(1))-methyltransferase CbiD [Dissulfuribacterales bacterium]
MTEGENHTGLRKGFSTGASAAIAAKGAVMQLLGVECTPPITIKLPTGKGLSVTPIRWRRDGIRGVCTVIKDGGDDPDVTHLAEIGAYAWWEPAEAIKGEGFYEELIQGLFLNLRGGTGVGKVTKPGLPVGIGLPAINPMPRRMICEAVGSVLISLNPEIFKELTAYQLIIEILVPKGEELAQHTLNPRLGILGGISILGTTGIVKPFSHGAYRATIASALKVAQACGVRHVVLCTGTTSETFAQRLYELPPEAFVQMADYVKFSLEFASHLEFERITTVCFIGKAIKIAQGLGQTHASQGAVDMEFLTALTQKYTSDNQLIETLQKANTGRHALEILRHHEAGEQVIEAIGRIMAQRMKGYLTPHTHAVLNTIILDFDGNTLFQRE